MNTDDTASSPLSAMNWLLLIRAFSHVWGSGSYLVLWVVTACLEQRGMHWPQFNLQGSSGRRPGKCSPVSSEWKARDLLTGVG
jgi:hypothetical protein